MKPMTKRTRRLSSRCEKDQPQLTRRILQLKETALILPIIPLLAFSGLGIGNAVLNICEGGAL